MALSGQMRQGNLAMSVNHGFQCERWSFEDIQKKTFENENSMDNEKLCSKSLPDKKIKCTVKFRKSNKKTQSTLIKTLQHKWHI